MTNSTFFIIYILIVTKLQIKKKRLKDSILLIFKRNPKCNFM